MKRLQTKYNLFFARENTSSFIKTLASGKC